jgi:NAD(P)H-hydrate epimerase
MKTPRVTAREVARALPERRPDSHKGENGVVLIVGGSERYVGAPALTALAALRSGADLAIVAAPERTAWTINTFSPDLLTIKLPGSEFGQDGLGRVEEEMRRATAVVVGPGLGLSERTSGAVLELARMIRKANLPALFDADGLKALAPRLSELGSGKWVLTPHAGEFQIISGKTLPRAPHERIPIVSDFARRFGCVILLKAQTDIIASPDGRVKLNTTGNPGMTVGGTGDVLAGIVGTLLSQGVPSFEAAFASAWISGRAGDLCMKERGYEFLASDVINKIPDVFRELRRCR